MRKFKKEGSKKGLKMFKALSKNELHFIRGGDQKNTEKEDGGQ